MNQLLKPNYSYNPLFDLCSNKDNDDEDEEAPEGSNGPVGINEWSPEARKRSSKAR